MQIFKYSLGVIISVFLLQGCSSKFNPNDKTIYFVKDSPYMVPLDTDYRLFLGEKDYPINKQYCSNGDVLWTEKKTLNIIRNNIKEHTEFLEKEEPCYKNFELKIKTYGKERLLNCLLSPMDDNCKEVLLSFDTETDREICNKQLNRYAKINLLHKIAFENNLAGCSKPMSEREFYYYMNQNNQMNNNQFNQQINQLNNQFNQMRQNSQMDMQNMQFQQLNNNLNNINNSINNNNINRGWYK